MVGPKSLYGPIVCIRPSVRSDGYRPLDRNPIGPNLSTHHRSTAPPPYTPPSSHSMPPEPPRRRPSASAQPPRRQLAPPAVHHAAGPKPPPRRFSAPPASRLHANNGPPRGRYSTPVVASRRQPRVPDGSPCRWSRSPSESGTCSASSGRGVQGCLHPALLLHRSAPRSLMTWTHSGHAALAPGSL